MKLKVLRFEVVNEASGELGVMYITLRAKLRGVYANDPSDISYGLNFYYNSLEDDNKGELPKYLKNFVLFKRELDSVVTSQSDIILEDLGYQVKVRHHHIRILDFSTWSHHSEPSSRDKLKKVVKADCWEFSTLGDRERKGYSTISPLIEIQWLIQDMLANPVIGEDSVLSYLCNPNEELEVKNLTYNMFN